MFSIEGLDVVVPMLDEIATLARQDGAEEVVIGMAHRGRLAVLAHNLGRSVESILAEFEGAKALERVKAIAAIPHSGTGDVKYHHGAEGLVHDAATASRSRSASTRTRATSSSSIRWSPAAPAPRRPSTRARSLHHSPRRRRPGAAARRRRLPGPGGGRRDAQPAVARGLLDRRHDPPDHRQPGRLHHRPRGGPLDPVRRRHGEGLQLPDHPRQRRRRRGAASPRSAWRWPTASGGAATSSST